MSAKKRAVSKRKLRGQLPQEQFLPALQEFAGQITAKFSAPGAGEPEDQLRSPVEVLLSAYGEIISKSIILKGEPALKGRLGRPDFAAYDGRLLVGYVELKAPGKGADPKTYKGHDRDQWKRFQSVPNMVYADGNEWAVYRNGERAARRVRLAGDIRTDGKDAVTPSDAKELFRLFAEFTSWTPIVPQEPKDLAAFLAPYCRLIREDVLDGLKDGRSPLHSLKREIRKLLFPDATDEQFADAYAQTVIFALLLARMERADVLDLASAYAALESHHLLLSRSLQFLTDPQAATEMSTSLSLAQRVIHEVQPEALRARSPEKDPWLFFYEHFLGRYDPDLRKSWGVYYTPVEVVRAQVRLVDEILSKHLGKDMGFVEPGVITLDPALGTGTYLLGIVDHALQRVAEEEGHGAVKGGARSLVQNLHGFEWMVGPYAVAQLRFSRALTSRGATLPPAGIGIYLTNTLESPHTRPPAPPLFHRPIAREHERALRIKDAEPVLVCLGNPPYGRHVAADETNVAITGGWVRHGDTSAQAPDPYEKPILDDFIEPARRAGHGVHMKNLYNLYVYFIRWALWKVFEHRSATGPGIVSFITCASYLEGDAFAGLREHMRRECDHIDIIDLGGEGRGTRRSKNVFAIQTPVAIFVAWRKGRRNRDRPATVRYARIDGTREQKLKKLDGVWSARDLKWKEAPSEWQAPFRSVASGAFTRWPLLTDIFPWQHSGVMAGRTWVIAESDRLLKLRWEMLSAAASSQERRRLFKESPTGRKVEDKPPVLPHQGGFGAPVNELMPDDKHPPILELGFRSFDRQMILADNRLLDRPGPDLWYAHSDNQIYLNSLVNHPLGNGPALSASAFLPDKHFFRGSYGGNGVMPLCRDSASREPNILPGLLDMLSRAYGKAVSPEDLAGYVYCMLAQPEYTRRFERELADRKVRVPLTKDRRVFFKAAESGNALVWLHTYGERMAAHDRPRGRVPNGRAKCLKAVPDTEDKYPNKFSYEEGTKTLRVGEGSFGPVEPEVFEFGVSGLKVVRSWLGYRMRERKGKKSSPLDDIRPKTWTHQFTRELLELLWVLEKTVAGYPKQKKLLVKVLASKLFKADELPSVPDAARKAPKVGRKKHPGQGEFEY